MAEAEVKQTTKKQTKTTKSSLEIPVYDVTGKEVKTISLSKDIFGAEANKHLIAQYVRVYLVNQRQGTVSTKTRSEVTGTTKKIYRQKGTGNARHGSKKAPIFVGGGVTFGPQPREHMLKMNKKQKKQALFTALSMQAQNGSVYAVASEVAAMKPKTKDITGLLKNIGLAEKKVLVIVPELTKNGLVLSSRNISNIELVPATTINPYMILNHQATIFVEDALVVMEKHFLSNHAN
jgi:large subunit ribosomal protein L4